MAIKKGGGQADLILNIILGVVVIGILGVYFLRQFRVWKTKEQKLTWPLNTSPCPDNWLLGSGPEPMCTITSGSGSGNWPGGFGEVNTGNCTIKSLGGKPKIYSYDFSGHTDQSKCGVAKACGIAWDGISDKC
jgi:hypothetical protein